MIPESMYGKRGWKLLINVSPCQERKTCRKQTRVARSRDRVLSGSRGANRLRFNALLVFFTVVARPGAQLLDVRLKAASDQSH